MQPSRRPKDGRYGENPNRLQHYYQFQVILKPSPEDLQELYLKSLAAIGVDAEYDIRFVEDDWESPTLGAWGLGWECWCDGSPGVAVHLFPAGRQLRVLRSPASSPMSSSSSPCISAGRRPRLRSQLQRPRGNLKRVTYGDVFLQAEGIFAACSKIADTDMLFEQFKMAEAACRKYLAAGWDTKSNVRRHLLALPAYDQCIKASHVFNLLDARGVISVTERQSYILRVRELAKACGEAWLATEGGGPA